MQYEKIQLGGQARLYAYINNSGAWGDKPRPAVIVLPGGGYIACSPTEGEPVALRFASMGYNAFVLKYSTLFPSFEQQGGLEAASRRARFPQPVHDLGNAFKVIGSNALKWRVDPKRIALCGFSAGGHLAASYANGWSSPEIADAVGASPESLRPAACILSYAVTDIPVMTAAKLKKGRDPASDMFAYAVFGTLDPAVSDQRALSPVCGVSADTPPTFLWHTRRDTDVPVENTLNMALALDRQGIDFELHVFERGDHALSLADESTVSDPALLNPDAAKWIGLALCWLKKHI